MTWFIQQMNDVGQKKEQGDSTQGPCNQLNLERDKFYDLNDPISWEGKYRDISTKYNV